MCGIFQSRLLAGWVFYLNLLRSFLLTLLLALVGFDCCVGSTIFYHDLLFSKITLGGDFCKNYHSRAVSSVCVFCDIYPLAT